MVWHGCFFWWLVLASLLEFIRLVSTQSALPINWFVAEVAQVQLPPHYGVTVLYNQRSVHRVKLLLFFKKVVPQKQIKRDV